MAIADVVSATLFYSTYPADGTKPFFSSTVDPATGQRQSNIVSIPKQLTVENIRGKEDQYDLDTSGFKYIRHTSALKDFNNDEEIERVYYPESIEVLKKYTGATRVVIFDHSSLGVLLNYRSILTFFQPFVVIPMTGRVSLAYVNPYIYFLFKTECSLTPDCFY